MIGIQHEVYPGLTYFFMSRFDKPKLHGNICIFGLLHVTQCKGTSAAIQIFHLYFSLSLLANSLAGIAITFTCILSGFTDIPCGNGRVICSASNYPATAERMAA